MKAVNLLPSQLRDAPVRGRPNASPARTGGAGPLLVLAGLALCLVAMAAWVLTSNAVAERRAELARVTSEHEAAAARAAALQPYGDFQALAIRRRETVASLAGLRFDWEQALRDVSYALPGGVTLSTLDGTISSDAGSSGSALRGAIASPAISLKGCTRNQAVVPTMMSRLRAIRGVTRVSLAKSEKLEDVSAPGKPGPCGSGSTPQFDLVVFFERSVAATAPTEPGATASTTPAPTPETASGSSTPATQTASAAPPATP